MRNAILSLLLASACVQAGPIEDARAALALALALRQRQPAPPAPKADPYADARAEAVSAGKPLIVFVGQESRPVAGCVVVSLPHYLHNPTRRVIIRRMKGGEMVKMKTLKGSPSAKAIRKVAIPAKRVKRRPRSRRAAWPARPAPIMGAPMQSGGGGGC